MHTHAPRDTHNIAQVCTTLHKHAQPCISVHNLARVHRTSCKCAQSCICTHHPHRHKSLHRHIEVPLDVHSLLQADTTLGQMSMHRLLWVHTAPRERAQPHTYVHSPAWACSPDVHAQPQMDKHNSICSSPTLYVHTKPQTSTYSLKRGCTSPYTALYMHGQPDTGKHNPRLENTTPDRHTQIHTTHTTLDRCA